MDESSPSNSPSSLSEATEVDAATATATAPFVGRWNHLVSTTNWEKGEIIQQWREALIESAADPVEYSDEAWSQQVGGVTGQHVGRLRRVYVRFGDEFAKFESLFWSHFQAALDWDDAEMWLEGAVQNSWSVAKLRTNRWETLGAPADLKPREEDIVSTELDEDFEPARTQDPAHQQIAGSYEEVQGGPTHEGPDFGDEPPLGSAVLPPESPQPGASKTAGADPVRPFEDLTDLPDDVLDAVETFKLAIVRHRSDSWSEISQTDLIQCLEALKQLALAPSDE